MKLDYSDKKIAIAEDNKDSLTFMEIVLNKTGASIFPVTNGIELIELLKSEPGIDLVFLDIKMPEMDGLEACGIIRGESNDIPLVAATAYAGTHEIQKMIEAGITDILVKPFVPKSVYEIMDKYFDRNNK